MANGKNPNLSRVMDRAEEIVARIVHGDDTMRTVAAEFRVSVRCIRTVVLSRACPGDLAACCRRKLSARAKQLGQRAPGRKPIPVGTVKIEKRGRVHVRIIKVCGIPGQTRWALYSAHLWSARNGPVPKGRIIAHANGDILDDRIENLILLTRAEFLSRRRRLQPEIEARRIAALSKSGTGHKRARGRRWVMECDACGESKPCGPRSSRGCGHCGSPMARKTFRLWAIPPAASVIACDPVPMAPAQPADPRIESFSPLAHRVARRMHARMPRRVMLGDVESAAVDGLYAACRTFDPAKGASFPTYAARKVKLAILDWQRSQNWVRRRGRELAAIAGVAERRMVAETDLGELAPPAVASRAGPAAIEADELWRRVLRSVPARQARVLNLVYREGMSQREAAGRLCVSESCVSLRHADAIARLRRRWTPEELARALGLDAGKRRVA